MVGFSGLSYHVSASWHTYTYTRFILCFISFCRYLWRWYGGGLCRRCYISNLLKSVGQCFGRAGYPWPAIQDLLAHDYGIITLGLRYAVAIILPIVGFFSLFFD